MRAGGSYERRDGVRQAPGVIERTLRAHTQCHARAYANTHKYTRTHTHACYGTRVCHDTNRNLHHATRTRCVHAITWYAPTTAGGQPSSSIARIGGAAMAVVCDRTK
jgi:hypothetical protein